MIPGKIKIGYEGEINARYVDLDISELIAMWPGCTPSVLHKRKGDTDPYPVTCTLDGDILRWKFSAVDAAKVGWGVAQIVMTNSAGTIVGKSRVIETECARSLSAAGTVPVVVKPWTDQVLAAASTVTASAQSASASAQSASASATQASTSASSASQSASQSASYATSAGNSATNAQQSANSASESASSASASASSASASAVTAQSALAELEEGIASGDFKGDKGDTGNDGVSPTVSVTEISNGHKVTITDAEGTHSFDVSNGSNGTNGTNGVDGYSPTASVQRIDGGARITVTDQSGTTTADVNDGTDGDTYVSDLLWELNEGVSYTKQTDNTSAYSKTVLAGAKAARMMEIGGHTEVVDGALVSADVVRVESNDADSELIAAYAIPSAVRTAYPLRSAGNVHDSYEFDGAKWWHVNRIGYSRIDELQINMTTNNVFMLDTGVAQNNSVYVEYYTRDTIKGASSMDDSSYHSRGTSAGYDGKTYIRDTRYSTANEFSQGAGSYHVAYPLQNPIRTDITTLMDWNGRMDVEAGGSLTFVQSATEMDVPSGVQYIVQSAVTHDVQINGTSITQDGVANITLDALGAERQKGEWVLKGTWTDPRGINVDFSGCTEFVIKGTVTATANTNIMTNKYRLSYNGITSAMKSIFMHFIDFEFGLECIDSKCSSSDTVQSISDTINHDVWLDGSKTENISKIYVYNPDAVTSCNLQIYAR